MFFIILKQFSKFSFIYSHELPLHAIICNLLWFYMSLKPCSKPWFWVNTFFVLPQKYDLTVWVWTGKLSLRIKNILCTTHEDWWKKIKKKMENKRNYHFRALKIYKERPVKWTKCCAWRVSSGGFSSVTLTNMNLYSIWSYLYLKYPHQFSFWG